MSSEVPAAATSRGFGLLSSTPYSDRGVFLVKDCARWKLEEDSMASVSFSVLAMFAAAYAASSVHGQQGDSLFVNGSLLDDHTLVSAGGIFELGFFSFGNSGLYYLGIWYKDIPPIPTVIWVANKGKPVNNSRILALTSDGNLIILNSTGGIHWQTGTRNVINPFVQLLNTGNLVLSGGKSPSILWQSFDDPFDTYLPGMKLEVDLRSNHDRHLTSWRSPLDPSPGDCTYKIRFSGLPELYLSANGIPIYRTGPWTGKMFSGRPVMNLDSFKFEFVSNQLEAYYSVQILDSSMLFRAVLNGSSRQFERYRWSSSEPAWKLLMIPFDEPCDNYAYCGAHGVCIPGPAVCQCLNGFNPKSQKDWNLKGFSSGCVRKTSLDCQADGFLLEQHVKLPDTSNATSSNRSLDECRDWCLKNCTCTAYNFNEGSGCITWTGDLIDLRTLVDGGDKLYYRVAASELAASKRKPILLVVIVSLPALALLICTALLLFKKYMGKDPGLLDMQDLTLYDFTAIEAATNNFSIDNKLGMGCFGEVYKGQLKDGQQIAAKKLSRNSMQGTDEFKNEVLLITRLQHRNLVQLLGCCVEGEERILIYEHMENRSLDTFIFDKSRSMLLNWQKRLTIILGIARGLLYLHEDSRLNVIHRDLKPSNILLDKEMNPKISDFGIAAIFERDKSKNGITTKVVGTIGYMAPEYSKRGIYSVKSDVFSFGVIVLEMLSGRRNNLVNSSQPFVNLLSDAWRLWQDGRSLELLDESLEGPYTVSQVSRCIQVGLLCVQEKSEDRPTMEEVYRMLGSDGIALPHPKPAIPIVLTGFKETLCSCNQITITIEAR